MKKLRWEIIVLLCVVMLSGQVHAAISTSGSLTGPALVNEGDNNYFNYAWSITHDTIADRTYYGTVEYDFGDGSSGNQYLAGYYNYSFSGTESYGKSYADEGIYTLKVSSVDPIGLYDHYRYQDWDGYWHSGYDYIGDATVPTRSMSVTVLNVAPTIQSMTAPLTVDAGVNFAFSGYATDPGINDILTYSWDLDNDGAYDDAVGASGVHNYAAEGLYTVGLRVGDGDGGFDYDSFEVSVIPEPGVMAMMGVCTLGLWGYRRVFPCV